MQTLEKQDTYRGVRFLQPDELELSLAPNGSLRVHVNGEGKYERVRAYCALPVSCPTKFISLRYGEKRSEEIEIGVIRDLSALLPSQRKLVQRELDKRYFVHKISRIRSIKLEFGFLYWEVETDRGIRNFSMPCKKSHCIDFNEKGRMILDTDGNQYYIADLEALDDASRRMFEEHIYW